ncbi:MAG TPA: RHS repeat-associated core domain-containing protein [Gemmatimonadaceae bacterium]|nr:RHS repeat-associated core domain-containing protein [Gemmatimonadaceae bacterium]
MRHALVVVRPRVIKLLAVASITTLPFATAQAQLSVAVHDINPGTALTRSACLSLPAGNHARVECGDLRVVQPLPATTTMTKTRAPSLTYLSRHAIPGGVMALDVTVDSAINPASLLIIMSIPGKDTVSRSITWNSAWRGSNPYRVVLPFDARAKSVATGVYTYTMEVRAISGGVTTNTASVNDTLVVVDRYSSPFGKGWWLQGLELLNDNTPDTTRKLWIGGDGSTRVYRRQSDSVWTVVPTIDRPDTLRKLNSGGTITWRRSLGNNAYVEFDNTGRHIATVNEQNHKTRFVHSANTLDSIVLPVPVGSGAVPAYLFKYVTVGGSPMLDTVHAPKNPSASHRRVIMQRTNRVITGFSGTDFTWHSALNMVYDTATGRMNSGTGSLVTFTWGSGTLVTEFSIAASDMGGTVITTLCPAEGASLVSCATTPPLASAASTKIDGPRTDVSDTSRVWLTGFGAVRRARNPFGDTSAVFRENGSFPLLITKTVGPNGFTQRATYTSRGLVDSLIDVDPLGTSVNAVTRHSWHSTFNRVTMTISPTSDTTQFDYDGNGTLAWQQVGSSSATRTNFAPDSSRRIEYVQPPGHNSGQRHHFEYDAYLGNLLRSTTPLGIPTETVRDTVGQVRDLISPIDSNPSSNVKALKQFTYDAWNRVLTTKDRLYNSATTYPITYAFDKISGTTSGGTGNTFPRVTTELNTSYEYDMRGNMIYVRQRDSAWTSGDTWVTAIEHSYSYNTMNLKTGEGVESGAWSLRQYTYNQAGQLATVRGWGSVAGEEEEKLTEFMTERMYYDAAGRLTSRAVPAVDAPGIDPFSALTYGATFPSLGVAFPASAFGGPACGSNLCVPADSSVFTYDGAGNMLTANNVDAQIKRSFYANGALKTDSLRIDTHARGDFTAHKYGLKYEYDLSNRRTSMQLPTNLGHGCTPGAGSGCAQTYHYKRNIGALDTLTSYTGHIYTFGYDDASRLITRTAPGGVVLDMLYDLDDRLTRRLERRGVGILGSPVTVHLDSLWYDGRGKLKKGVFAGTADAYQRAQFAYAVNGSLGAAEYIKTADTATETFRSSALANLIASEKNGGATSTANEFSSGTGDLLAQSKTSSFVDIGLRLADSVIQNMKSALGSGTNGFESSLWYGRDGRPRLFQRVGVDTTPETRFVFEEYRYDALGRRVLLRSQTRGTCTASFCKQAIERYIWDGDQLLFEIRVPGDSGKSSAALEADTSTISAHYGRIAYVHAGGIDAPLGLDRNGIIIIPNANYRGFYDAGVDTVGNSFTTNINWIGREKDPFMDGALPKTVNGWSGSLISAQQDQSGLMYRRNRYYDPGTGRFTQSDPIGLRGGNNLFGYASGDPINLADPLGLSARSHCECTYDQSSGMMSCTAETTEDDGGYMIESMTATGYAGNGDGVNNPDEQDIASHGPIPRGTYGIGPAQDTNLGSPSFFLTPKSDNDMEGRSRFWIHADNSKKNQSASKGCIVLPLYARQWIAARGCSVLDVVR